MPALRLLIVLLPLAFAGAAAGPADVPAGAQGSSAPPQATATPQTTAPPATPAAAPASIAWNEWSNEVFKRAVAEDKPVLLFVRTPWSRASLWAEEKLYTDPQVITLASEKWIPVIVDRDRRPDIDQRYQIAVGVVSKGEAGWPLTAMLFDTGEVLSGRSLVPLEDRMGRPGLRSLLDKTADYYHTNKSRAPAIRELVMLQFDRERHQVRPPRITPAIIDEMFAGMKTSLDPVSGGFGHAPRVPTPLVPELAAMLHRSRGEQAYLDFLRKTLDGMEAGAIHDRVGGGFHRSSLDPIWRFPEFEKLLSFNAPLLVDYLLAFQATGDPVYRRTAEGIIDFLLGTLGAPDGGFYIAQWAAAAAEEPKGLYPSWSEEEFKKVVPADLHTIAATLFDVSAQGDVTLGPPARNLLYLAMPRKEAAQRLGITTEALAAGEAGIVSALARARGARVPPPVEKAIYVDSCSSAIVALFEAQKILGRQDAGKAAVAALDRLLAGIPADGPLLHRAYPAPVPGLDPALAIDHIMLARAAIAGFEATGRQRYLAAAQDLVARAVELFWDKEGGGFFDIVADPAAPGFMSLRRRLQNDTSYPSLNSVAARVLDRLWLHTGNDQYRERAETSLAGLIAMTAKVDQHDAGIGIAVLEHTSPPARYVVVGADDAKTSELVSAAGRVYDPGKIVRHLAPGRDDAELSRLGLDAKARTPYVVLCRDGKCSTRAGDEEALRKLAWPSAPGVPQQRAPQQRASQPDSTRPR